MADEAPPRIALVAGEASGDLLGAELIRALRARAPHIEFYGVGGPRMRAVGCDILVDASALAVRGLTEVLAHLPRLVRLRRALYRRFAKDRPTLFIGIDAPDFNLGLEALLKRRGVRTLHYVSPSVWAWRSERINRIGRAADRILTLFPFEPDLYTGAGVRATYVGHPLADRAPLDNQRRERRLQRQLTKTQPVVALLPGSRTSELALHAPLFIDVARRFHAREPETHFLVPLVNRETRTIFEDAMYRDNLPLPPMTLLYGHADDAFIAADVALVASGTATLEAALYRCPHVITYRVGRWTARWVRKHLEVPWVGLPNVLAQQFIVPEILQEDAEGETLAQALHNLFVDKTVRLRLADLFERMHHALRQGSAERAAAAVLEEIGPRAT